MNWNFLSVACAALAVIGLSACETAPTGPVIRNPTVDEMNQMDAQMGLKPAPKPGTGNPSAPTPGVYVPDAPAGLPTYPLSAQPGT
jgi:hypothetical protein